MAHLQNRQWPSALALSMAGPEGWSQRRDNAGNMDEQAAEGSQCSCCVIHHNLKHLFSFLFRETALPVSCEALPVLPYKMAHRE